MAKPKKNGAAPSDGNGYNQEAFDAFVRRYEAEDEELASLRGEYMAACKEPRENQKSILAEAKQAGFSPKVVKAKIALNALEKKAQKQTDGMNIDDLSQFESLAKIGPLGEAALKAAQARRKQIGSEGNTAKEND